MNAIRIFAGVVVLALIAGCSSTPEYASQVDTLNQRYKTMAADPMTAKYAPVALRDAKQSLEKTQQLMENNRDKKVVLHQAYLTQKKLDIVEETAKMKHADEIVANADSQRKEILLQAKSQEAAQAKMDAAVSEARASAALQYAHQLEEKALDLEKEVQNLTTQETERGLVLTLGSVLFDVNKATLKSGSQRSMEKIAEFLEQYPDRNIVVEGFTDDTGSDSYNENLSQERANAVKQALTYNGVAETRIDTKGYGEQYPIASNDTSAGRQQNRRVEIIVAHGDGEPVDERS